MGLTKLAIQRPVFILMIMVLIVMIGRMAFQSMRVEENPDVSFGMITISTIYPGAGAEEVNNLVSREIEEAVSGVAGLVEVTSTSQEGVSLVMMQFDVGTDIDAALNDTRSKVDSRLGSLPDEVQKPILQKQDTTSEPVIYFTLKSDTLSNRDLRDLADNVLKDRFAQIDGVAAVNVSGGDQREIQVSVKKDALLRYGIGILDVQQAVQAASINVPAGRVNTGAEEFSVRVIGEYKSPEEIGEIYLSLSEGDGPDAGRRKIQLKDVAEIKDANVERRSYSRLDGSDAVIMSVSKTKEGNAIEISNAIRETPVPGGDNLLAALEVEHGVEFVVNRDVSNQIEESLSDLQFALGFGILLVILVVFMFLHNLRGTLIVAIAIPLCLGGALIVLWAAGFTINNMTMLALSLAIGVLVDDAIVIIENIYRHLTQGEEPVEAAINGRMEIGLAAIAITLADVVVFVPIAFMGGIVGQFFKALGIGFAVTVLFSLFVSFTVTPMLASRWYRKGEDWEHPTGKFAQWFERGFDKFKESYARLLRWALDRRWYMFAGGFAVLVAVFMMIGGSFAENYAGAIESTNMIFGMCAVIGVLVFLGNLFNKNFKPKYLLYGLLFGAVFPLSAMGGFAFAEWKGEAVFKFAFFPPSDSGQVDVSIELPPGASLSETQAVVERIEAIVMLHPEAEYVQSDVGRRGGGGFSAASQGTNYGRIGISLHDKKAMMDSLKFWSKSDQHMRTVSDTSVAGEMLRDIGRIPGANVTVSSGSSQGFGRPIQMSFQSNDGEALTATTAAILQGLNDGEIEGVISPEISSKPGKPELQAIPDRVKLGDLNMTVAEVGAAMRVLYEGDNQAKYRVQGREYDIRVMMDKDDRNDLNLVSQVPVRFQDGMPIYLTDVADLQRGVGVDKIDRRNRAREVGISADLLPGFAAGTVQLEIDNWMEENGFVQEGVTYSPQGQADIQNREMGYLLGALGLGLILVYMLLASLYDNLLYPFIIQLAQPQALTGAILALVITDKTLNIVGMIGIIALVGLVGKNAILLVDYTNTLRARGLSRYEALVESGRTRLRPIMMTTLALIFGMLPIALAIGRGSEFRETIGITIIGGVTLSTVLTLLIIPCSYSIFDDMSEKVGGRLRKWTRTKADVSAYRTDPEQPVEEDQSNEPSTPSAQ